MQFKALAITLFAGLAAAQFSGVCFDDFDCIGQGTCVKSGTLAIVGSCSGASSTGSGGVAIPTSFSVREAEPEAEAEAEQ